MEHIKKTINRAGLIIIIIFLSNCSAKTQVEFKKFGVKFLIPDGWQIGLADSMKNGNLAFTCKRTGIMTANNIVSIIIFNDSSDLKKLIQDQISFNQKTLAIMNPKFDSIRKSTFKGHDSYKAKMTTTVSKVKTVGYIECFHLSDKDIVLNVMENTNDTIFNKPSLNKLLTSFTFRQP